LLKLDISQFESCLAENKYKEMVAQNVALSQKLGVKAAPIFIIGMVDSNDSSKVKGISFLTGAQRIDAFKKEIDQVVLQPINLKP
jgi:predicted DsbA family dithiol-disulfide isomerase